MPETKLKTQTVYRQRFRLSAFDLSARAGVTVNPLSPEFKAALDQHKAGFRQTASFIAVLVGLDEPDFGAIKKRTDTFTVDVDKLRAWEANPALRPSFGKDAPHKVIQDATLGQFSFDFAALKPGRHHAGVVIVDEESGVPVQTISVILPVESAGKPEVNVTGDSLVTPPASQVAASLVLFELPATNLATQVQSVFVSRNDESGKYEVLAWNTGRTAKALRDLAKPFVSQMGNESMADQLRRAGYNFGAAIFDPIPDNSTPLADLATRAAEKARELLLKKARQNAAPPPTLVIRISTVDRAARYESAVLPFAAIGIGHTLNDAVFLGERFAMSLLLPGQSAGAEGECAPNWYLAFPAEGKEDSQDALDLAASNMKPALKELAAQVKPQPKNLSDLGDWLDYRGEAEPYVLAYVGHHSELGTLYHDKDQGEVQPGAIRRKFSKNSIAFLNACTSLGGEITTGTAIGTLAKHNVGATVASMSSVSGELAAAYMNCLAAVLKSRGELSIGEAHLLTTRCLWSRSGARSLGFEYEFSAAALKYSLVGNPFQKICMPQTPKK